jgi:hypothetical protein
MSKRHVEGRIFKKKSSGIGMYGERKKEKK